MNSSVLVLLPSSQDIVKYILFGGGVIICALVFYAIFTFVAANIRIRKFRKFAANYKPEKHLAIPGLGTLGYYPQNNLWEGDLENPKLSLCLAGNADGPNPRLVEIFKSFDLAQLQSTAIDFILSDAPKLDRNALTLDAINFLWEDRPDEWALEFTKDSDPDVIWRVEFKNGKPVSSNRDD